MDRRTFLTALASLPMVYCKSEKLYATEKTLKLATFNNRLFSTPDEIIAPRSLNQVEEALRRSLNASDFAIRSGGHCFEGHSSLSKGALVDLKFLTGIKRDSKNTYRLGPGVRLGQLYSFLRRDGRIVPGGSCAAVGAGGHIIGGGYGVLSRQYGLISDYLCGVTLTRVDSRGSVVTEYHDSGDVLWAHRGGGGGNFGIVSEFFLRDLPPVPREINYCSMRWAWKDLSYTDFENLVSALGQYLQANSGPRDPAKSFFCSMQLQHKAIGGITLSAFDLDSDWSRLEEFARICSTATRIPPEYTTEQKHRSLQGHYQKSKIPITRILWTKYEALISSSANSMRGKQKSAYLKKAFPKKQLEVLFRYLTQREVGARPARLGFKINAYGGAVNRISSGTTAVVQRSSIMKLQFAAYWKNADEDKPVLGWLNDLYHELYSGEPLPDEVHDGCFVNYCDDDLREWERLYYGDNYQRLQKVKKICDPRNVFVHSQSIRSRDFSQAAPPGRLSH